MTRLTPVKNRPCSRVLAVEQHRADRRRERHGVEDRQHDGKRNRQRELLIQTAGRAGEERDRREDRHQHDADHDDGAEHFAHGVDAPPGCAALAVLAHVPFDVLDDHDRIVDDDARGEHDAEQRERVDREVEQLEERERADRATPGIVIAGMIVLRQFCRKMNITRMTSTMASAERLQHLDDRFADDADVVEGQRPLQTRRKVALESLHLLPSRR